MMAARRSWGVLQEAWGADALSLLPLQLPRLCTQHFLEREREW